MIAGFPRTRVRARSRQLVHSDDGVGVHAIHQLQTRRPRSSRGRVARRGNPGIEPHSPHLGFSRLLVIDAVDVG